MRNLTLRVDENVIRKVRKAAIDKHTTLTEMVRAYLESVAAREDSQRRERARRLRDSFSKHSREMGGRTWTRDDLHER